MSLEGFYFIIDLAVIVKTVAIQIALNTPPTEQSNKILKFIVHAIFATSNATTVCMNKPRIQYNSIYAGKFGPDPIRIIK